MKKFVLGLFILFIFLGVKDFGYGKEVLHMATSAQIAHAFGMDVVKEFEQKHNIKVNVFICCSETALERLVNGFCDIACVAFRLPVKYREQGYVEIPFAKDPLAIIVNSKNSLKNITTSQIRQIFSHQITNWSVLIKGWESPIYTIIPNVRTALYKNFRIVVMQQIPISWDFKSYLSINVVKLVSNLENAIGFISNGALKNKKGIKKLKVNNKDVKAPDYPYFQTFSFVTKGLPNRNAKEFINAAMSKRGMEIIISKGMYPVF